MKIGSKIFQKSVVFLLLMLLAALGSEVVLASSSNATLLTTVPSHFVIDVTIVGDGGVIIDETELEQTAQISLERYKEVQIRLFPKGNSRVNSVVYNGKSFMNKMNNGTILLPALEKNAELKVTFVENVTIPDTWDTSFINAICYGVIAMISFVAIIVFAVKKARHKK